MMPWDSILRFHEAVIICLGAALLYGWLLRQLAEMMQWRRLRLAEIGEKYLTLNLSWRERRQIEFFLNNAFSPWIMIAIAGMLPPLLVWQLVKRPDQHVEQ